MTPEEIQRLQQLEEMEEMAQLRTQLGAKAQTNTSPQPYDPKPYFSNATGFIDRKEPNLEAAAKAGVDVTTGAPKGVHTGYESFAINEGQWTDFVGKEIKKVLGPEADIRRGPESGEYEYFDPTNGRWKVLRGTGLGQEVIKQSGNMMTTLGSMAGLIGGPQASVGKEILVGAGKTALGSGAADAVRTQIGNWLGVNQEVTPGEQLQNAAKVGAAEGAMDVAGGTAYNIARYVKKSVKGREVFTPEEAEQLLQGMGKYKGLVNDINANSDTQFTPFIHQLNDPDSAAAQIAESMYRRLAASSDPDIRLKVAQARANQWGAVRSYYANANAPYDAGLPATAEGRAQAGQGLQQGIQTEVDDRMAGVKAQVAQEEQAAMQAVAGLPDSAKLAQMDAASATRAQLFAQSQQSQGTVREAYKRFDEFIGHDAATGRSPYYVEIDDPELLTFINKFGRNTITGEMKGGGLRTSTSTTKTTEADGLLEFTFKDKNKKVDVSTLNETAKRLDQLFRDRTEAGMDVGYSDRDLLDAHGKILDKMSSYLQKGSLDGTLPAETYASWITARAEAKKDANLFKEGFLAKFLGKDKTGKWVINDQDALGAMLKGKDLQALGQIKTMIQHDPVAMGEIKKALFALYESKATKNGLPSSSLHKDFMKPDAYGEVMDLFFKSDDFKKLDSYKDMAESLTKTLENANTMEKFIKQDLGGKITRWSPEQLVRGVLRENVDSATAAKMVHMANKYGVRKEFQNGIMNEIQMKIFPSGVAGKVDFAALRGLLDKSGGNITAVMGPDYTNNLRKMADLDNVMNRAAAEINDPPSMTRLQMGLKAVVRPMSREGNFMSFLRQNRQAEVPAMVWEALTNPEALKKMANSVRIAVANTRVAGTGAAVIGNQIRDEDYAK